MFLVLLFDVHDLSLVGLLSAHDNSLIGRYNECHYCDDERSINAKKKECVRDERSIPELRRGSSEDDDFPQVLA